MIDLYTWTTPNGRKISIMLEEIGLPYRVISIDITNDQQFKPDFLKISPNAKIPAIVDRDAGFSLMESGAILIYLAEKIGNFLPGNGEARARTFEWLMFQMGGVGPMFGQTHHFVKFNPDASEYATDRFSKETTRLYEVMDKQLADTPYLAGNEYSIADIATWPWVARFEWQKIDLLQFPNVCRWYKDTAQRPAVQRGYVVPHKVTDIPIP